MFTFNRLFIFNTRLRGFIFITMLLLSLFKMGFTQNIEAIAKAKTIQVSGGLNASSTFYDAWGIEQRRDPFYWIINANLNFNFFGVVSAPFSINFSPQSKNFNYPYVQQQPFNQLGISPKYKWLTLHLGYRNMNFSSFTYSGNNFYGVGVEIAPPQKRYRFSLLYGRFAKALDEIENADFLDANLYNRWGYGGKFTYQTNKRNSNDQVEIILFKVWDQFNSALFPPLISENTPQENFIFGLNVKQSITKKISFQTEYANSALTRDTRSESLVLKTFRPYNHLNFLFQPKATSQYHHALNTNINYHAKAYNFQLAYRRIDPNYQSLGIPFMNNDLEDITANVSWRMLQSKLNLSTSGGIQRNNLNNTQMARIVRLVGSVSAGYVINPSWNVHASYSNFNTSTVKIRIQELDSLQYYQVTQNGSLEANYRKGNEKVNHTISFMGNYQTANDVLDNHSEMYNASTGYSYGLNSVGFNTSVFLNINVNSFTGMDNLGVGPTLSFSKLFLNKKLRTSIAFNRLDFLNKGKSMNKTTNSRLTAAYTLQKKHSFSLNLVFLDRDDLIGDKHFQEFTGTLGYGYRF